MTFHRLSGTDKLVTVTRTGQTDVWALSAYEPVDGHHVTMHVDGVEYGRIETRPIPDSVTESGPVNYDRIDAYAVDVRASALLTIYSRFPHLIDNPATQERGGSILWFGPDPRLDECGVCRTPVPVSDEGSNFCGSDACRRQIIAEATAELFR